MEYVIRTIDDLKIGEKASVQKTITDADVLMFAAVSLDHNPNHTNDEFAKKTMFKKRIVHGILTSSLISSILGTQLPGPGCLYVSQYSKFLRPVYIGDTIKATCEVSKLDQDKHRVHLHSYCENQDGLRVLDGEAVMSLPKIKKK